MFEEYEDLEVESFVKITKAPKTGKISNPRRTDHQIRDARKNKEKARQAILEEVELED